MEPVRYGKQNKIPPSLIFVRMQMKNASLAVIELDLIVTQDGGWQDILVSNISKTIDSLEEFVKKIYK
jgi:hypothetical protein